MLAVREMIPCITDTRLDLPQVDLPRCSYWSHAEEFLYDTAYRSTDASLPGVEARIPEWAHATADARIWLTPNLTGFKVIGRMAND